MPEDGRRNARRRLATGAAALSAIVLGSLWAPARAADLENLPPEVREGVSRVEIDWAAQRALLREVAELAPAEIDPSPLWVTFFVQLLIRGGASADEWRGLLEQRGADVELVCEIWRQFRSDDPELTEQMGRMRPFWEAVTALFPAEKRDPSTLPLDQALYLGEIQFWAEDIEGAKETYETLFERLPEGPTEGRACRGLMAYRIAQCLEREFDIRGAREWYLKCAEWGSPEQTGGYDVRAEGLVEAARMCRGLGWHAEADKHYQRALNECTGWGQAAAALDLARLAIIKGDEEKAERIYQEATELCGQGWGAGKLLMRRAKRAYWRGDREAALEYSQRVMQELAGAEWPPAERLANAAGDLIDRIHRWDDEPLAVSPEELRLEAGQRDVQFEVTTWQEPPIQVTSDVTCIDIQLSETLPKKPGEVRRTFKVLLKDDARPGTYEGHVVLTTTRARPLEIPISVTVAAP